MTSDLSPATSLQPITVPPAAGQSPTGTIVLLHGWGANAQDVAALSSYLNLPDWQLIMPNAPFAHPYGAAGRMWYGFPEQYTFQSNHDFENQADLLTSRTLLTHWIQALPDLTGVPLSRTILAGFSQGGAMTLDVGLYLPLAGLMVLSGYLHSPVRESYQACLPILMVHGRLDTVVPLSASRQAQTALAQLSLPVQYHELEMGHEIDFAVLKLMQEFVRQICPL